MAGQGHLDEGKGGRAMAGQGQGVGSGGWARVECWQWRLGEGRVLAVVARQRQRWLGNGIGGYMAVQANGYAR